MKKTSLIFIFLMSLLFTSCGDFGNIASGNKIEIPSEFGLNQKTHDRIKAINESIDEGFGLDAETRKTIEELNETLKGGIGTNEETLQRVDKLLRIIEEGVKIGIEQNTLDTIDEAIRVLEKSPDKWEQKANEIINELEHSAGTLAAEMAADVEELIEKARLNTEMVISSGGEEFRCNVDFMGTKAEETVQQFIGRSIIGHLKAIISGEEFTFTPHPWVCHVLPDRVELIRAGEEFIFDEAIINIVGYNYTDNNHPSVRLADEHHASIDTISLGISRQSDYKLQINLQGIDFQTIPERSKIEITWPDVDETTAIQLVFPPPLPPTANFIATPDKGTAPLKVQFTDNSQGADLSYEWYFADGETSHDSNPFHEFKNPGTYNVTLNIVNGQGTNVISKNIIVNEPPKPPTAKFEAWPTSLNLGETVEFTDQSENEPDEWLWDFGDGETSVLPIIRHSYPVAGLYKVTLTVTNEYGDDTESMFIDVKEVPPPPPHADFIAEPLIGNAPLLVEFTDQSTGDPASWYWDFGHGRELSIFTPVQPSFPRIGISEYRSIGIPFAWSEKNSTLPNPKHLFSEPGNYDVKLTVENSTGSHTVSETIIVKPKPIWSSNSIKFYKYMDLGNNVDINTGILAGNWYCGIVGMNAKDGDINEDGRGDILLVYMYEQHNSWRIRADFRTHKDHENWDIYTMCIDRKLEGIGFDYKKPPYEINDKQVTPTEYSINEYDACGVVGMEALNGDIESSGKRPEIIAAYAKKGSSVWEIYANFSNDSGKGENWKLHVLCLKKGESIYENEKGPFFIESYVNKKHGNFPTGIDPLNYMCGIVGLAAKNGDINEDGAGNILKAFMDIKNDLWSVNNNFHSHNYSEKWDIDMFCVSTAIAWHEVITISP